LTLKRGLQSAGGEQSIVLRDSTGGILFVAAKKGLYMKRIVSLALLAAGVMALLLAAATPAGAMWRVSSVDRSCDALRNILKEQGAILVTRPGTGDAGTVYDRYVSWAGLCGPGYVTEQDWVPTRDGQCRLSRCEVRQSPR
jgi:hypothetical protein